MTAHYLTSAAGDRIDVDLAGRIGTVGSQGSVWQVENQPGIVVKLIHRSGQAEFAERLSVMLAMAQGWCVRDGEVAITWPMGGVHRRDDGRLLGYYMPRLHPRRFAAGVGLFDLGARSRLLPGHTWEWMLRFASGLAGLVDHVHARGHVIGDLAPENIYFTPKAGACLIDVDGWQIAAPAANSRLWCPFSRRDYTAPEVPNGRPAQRAPSSDWWSLAVIIAQVLFLGFHPFGGVPVNRLNVLDEASNVRHRRLFVCGDDVRVPPGTPPLWLLPPRLRAMFARAFAEGYDTPASRPGPKEWAAELDQAQAELVTCPSRPGHVYSGHATRCPWCEVARARGVDPFGKH